jgi:DNA repair exonuclease SbcCD ATPase subunit
LAETKKKSAGEEATPEKTSEKRDTDDKRKVEKDLQIERQAYKAWKDTYEKLLQEIGDSWETLWKDTMSGLANKTIDYRTAADRLIVLNGRLGIIQKTLERLKAPSQLTAKHQALLNESADLTSRMVATRREGVQLVLEFLQGGEKDKLDSGLARVAGGDLYLVAALTKEKVVSDALGVKD